MQSVVGVGNAVGGETVADEFFPLVSTVADVYYAQLVEKFGDFRISFSIQTARVVEHFGFGRSYFCCDGAGRNDARHLAVDDVGFFLFQHLHVGEHTLDVAQDTALIKINRTPLDAQGWASLMSGPSEEARTTSWPRCLSNRPKRKVAFSVPPRPDMEVVKTIFFITCFLSRGVSVRVIRRIALGQDAVQENQKQGSQMRAYAKWWTG